MMKFFSFKKRDMNARQKAMRKRKRESGIALVAVLLLVVSGTALAGMVMAVSKSTTFTVLPFLQLQRSFYINEGVAARAQFLISADRSLFGSPSNMQIDNYSEYDFDRYLPDAVEHTIDYYGTWVTFTLTDGSSPVSLTGNNYTNALRQWSNFMEEDDSDLTDLTEDLTYRIQDYIDGDDDLVDDYSYEVDEYYEYFNASPLPRNAAITNRDEFGYIDQLKELYPVDKDGRLTYIRLIPPAVSGVTLDGNPDVFGVTDDWLYYAAGMDENDIEQLRLAIEDYHSIDRIPISESLDDEILNQLSTYVRWSATGVYTVTIRPATVDSDGNELEARTPGKRLSFTYTAQPVSGNTNGFVPFYEWMWF